MKIFQVDAFTNQVFKGNPAGVCILPPDKMTDNALMQNIAMEMNLSETAFLVQTGSRIPVALVHPGNRSAILRSRYTVFGAYSVGDRRGG